MKTNSKLFISALCFLGSYAFLFILWSFVLWYFDPKTWDEAERFAYVAFSLILGFAVAAAAYLKDK